MSFHSSTRYDKALHEELVQAAAEQMRLCRRCTPLLAHVSFLHCTYAGGRCGKAPHEELVQAAAEQMRITERRLAGLFGAQPAAAPLPPAPAGGA